MKKILTLASAVMLLVACSKSETNIVEPQGHMRQIKAKSAIEGVTTRAVVATDAEFSNIVFVRYDDRAKNLTGNFNFSATDAVSGSRTVGGAITFTPGQQYDMDDDKTVYIRGYHPAGTLVSGVATWTPDGATDILMTDVWNAGKYSSPITTGMVFRHILARIEVICQAEVGSSLLVVQTVWGKIESIKFADAMPDMTYTYATDAVAASGMPTDFMLLNGATYTIGAFTPAAIPANGSTAVTASAMLPPVMGTNVTLKIKTVEQGEITKAITLSGNFEKGKIHTVTLTFKANGKDIDVTTSSIEEWTDGYVGNGDIEI
ncbi:fimbrillin family protein [Parabacteroides faecis]|uniref:fimbrillin family protein n=1 Tax=Parabacteroides faecis TaxID=1217282 RepID=UPI002164E428|nr:fimbrillin family protein [Parabacteroides faecis]MCS2893548.1 fimbrillin family protein [Parabacteroides faecis]UVQ47856.1 fimbrillin family protein [Parabacteroides faecis]